MIQQIKVYIANKNNYFWRTFLKTFLMNKPTFFKYVYKRRYIVIYGHIHIRAYNK